MKCQFDKYRCAIVRVMKITHLDANTMQIKYAEPNIPFIGLFITTVLSKTGESYIETTQSFSRKKERQIVAIKDIEAVSIYTYYAVEKEGGKTKRSNLFLNLGDSISYHIGSGHLSPEVIYYKLFKIKRPQPSVDEINEIAGFLGVPVVNTDETAEAK